MSELLYRIRGRESVPSNISYKSFETKNLCKIATVITETLLVHVNKAYQNLFQERIYQVMFVHFNARLISISLCSF